LTIYEQYEKRKSLLGIIGNLFIDQIYNKQTGRMPIIRYGGIANFDIGIKIPLDFNKTVVLSDKPTSVKWDENSFKPSSISFDWCHFCYLDTIDLDIGKCQYSIASADLCFASRPGIDSDKVISNLKFIDYCFMAKNHQNNILYKNILTLTEEKRPKYTIVHDKTGVEFYLKDNLLFKTEHKVEHFNYTLGAGDKFAQFFIIAVLEDLSNQTSKIPDYRLAIEKAHEQTFNWLKRINKNVNGTAFDSSISWKRPTDD
jgi:hypothetical protein